MESEGKTTAARRIMEFPPAGPGKWWVNVAPLGAKPVWEVQVMPLPENDLLFGYEPREFLAKQYRRAA